jgi:DNA polymerase-3 subunit epsilon/ATP-dependent DNA helicase DinG
LPLALLEEINRAAQPFTWEVGAFFRDALEAVQSTSTNADQAPITELFSPLHEDLPALKANENTQAVDSDAIGATLDEGGAFEKQFPEYEARTEQIDMARAIASSFNKHEHLMIEAGTGTGKSLAYLLPALQWAQQNNQRVVISTNTINLQDQLFDKDVPALQAALGTNLNVAVMKGRGNYLCPRRLAAMRRRNPGDLDELRTLTKILIWLQESQSGDRGEINLRSGEFYTWSRLSAEDEGCTTHRCQSAMGGTCPYFKARKRAEAAHLVIANHALLIRDVQSENHVLPEFKHLIVDEAHQLENAITNGMSQRVDQTSLLRRLNDLGGANRGILGDLLRSARDYAPEKTVLRLEAFMQNISEVVAGMSAEVRGFFNAISSFIYDSKSEGTYKLRLDDKKRGHNAFSNVVGTWETLSEFFEVLGDAMQQLHNATARLSKYDVPRLDDHTHAIASAANYLTTTHAMLDALVRNPEPNMIYWINNANSIEYLSLQAAPLHVGALMEAHIWQQKDSVILTSATLRSAGSFDFVKERLYAEDVAEVALGSPFDYKASTLVYVPDDIPLPNENGYQRAVERGIVELAAALEGRVLALFTSYAQLRETAANISPRLALGNIVVYDQATGGSREALLDSFKSTERAVLLGTRSFWEGVDIPGDDLSALVIVRLPFAVPNDPIFAARSATYNNPFQQYAVPDAILRFRQGFGRLIRTRTDRGLVTILDSRVIHKSYGMKFLEALPDCTIQYGSLSELSIAAKNWLSTDPS